MTAIHRCTPRVALLLLLAPGCANQQPSTDHQAPPNALPHAAQGEESDAQGAPYRTIWTRPATPPNGRPRAALAPALEFRRLALSPNSFAMHVELTTGLPDDPRMGKAEKPALTVTVNGCPGPSLAFEGEVTFGGAPSILTLPRLALPQGDLEVSISAFEQQATMLLANDDKGLRPITMQEMRGYKRTPGNPAKGEQDTFTLERPACD
jgi:hypothetical protein